MSKYDDWKTDDDVNRYRSKSLQQILDQEARALPENMISDCCAALPYDELDKNNNGFCADCKEGTSFQPDWDGIWD